MWASVTYTFSPSTIAKSSEVNQNFTDILNNIEKGAPSGTGAEWFTNTAPAGWLLQDGSAVSRATYARLFSVIGTTYGAGDGSTTFNLPNKKGKVGVGRDAAQTEFDVLGETGGEKTHTLIESELPTINLNSKMSDPGHAHSLNIAGAGSGRPNQASGPSGFNISTASATTGITFSNIGSDGPHNNLQPYMVQNFIIKD